MWGSVMAKRASAKKAGVRKTARREGTSKSSGSTRRKSSATAKRRSTKKWSHKVTEESDALTLHKGVFAQRDPKKIAASLKRSAERSKRRKSNPFQSAMSMLNFYINRAGRNLPASRKTMLKRAKDELRKQFARE
jgi:Protein of unknown function (DUF3175)